MGNRFSGTCSPSFPGEHAPLDYQRHSRVRFRPMWGTIPLPSEKCPTSQRNPAPHRSGMLPHFKRNQCPTSTGIRSSTFYTEVPGGPLPGILDGFMISLLGLYDLYIETEDA